jgi:hypothetical protein
MKLTPSVALIFLLLAALVGLLQVASVSGASNGREKFAAKLDGMHERQKTGWQNEPRKEEKPKPVPIKSATKKRK